MVSVAPERMPFSMAGSYQPMAPPNAFGAVGGLQNPGTAVAAGGETPMPDIIRDGNNNSNRTVPYTRIVSLNNEDRIKQIEDLRGGSLAFVGKPRFRKRGGTLLSPGGVDAFSELASIDHVEKELKDKPALHLHTLGQGRQVDSFQRSGPRLPNGMKLPDDDLAIEDDAGNAMFRRGAKGSDASHAASCFLYPKEEYMVSTTALTSNHSTAKRRRDGDISETNPKVPNEAAKCALDALYQKWADDEEGPQPFTRWTPDGLVIYKYGTSDDPVSSKTNPSALDYEMDQKQGAMFNIAVQGPCLSIDWTGQSDLEMAKRCACLPRNNYYMLVVAKITRGEDADADADADAGTGAEPRKAKICRLLRTTSHDMHNYANSVDWMNLEKDELIIGGWKIGSVMDSAAAPLCKYRGHAMKVPEAKSSLMATRVAVSIRFVDSYYLHQKYFVEREDGKRHKPSGAATWRRRQ